MQQATGVTDEKENGTMSRRAKPPSRGNSAPPRAKTPSYAPKSSQNNGTGRKRSNSRSDAVTPAVRPGSSMSRSTSSKRPRLGESTSSHNNIPATGHRIPSARAASPTKTVGRTPSASSSLPRPVPLAMPVPKSGARHHALGRVASAHSNHRSHNYHPYPQTQRSTSAGGIRVYGAVNLNAKAERKAPRTQRKSFKPRPSMDDVRHVDANSVGAGGGGGAKRYPGFAGGVVQEEDEDF